MSESNPYQKAILLGLNNVLGWQNVYSGSVPRKEAGRRLRKAKAAKVARKVQRRNAH